MASDNGERPAKKMRTEAREEAEASIGLLGLRREVPAEERTQIYKDTYNQVKAEWEREVAEILAGLPEEIERRLAEEGVDTEQCKLFFPINAENVRTVAEVMKGFSPSGGRRRSETSSGRHQRGGAFKDDVYYFFKSVCTFPFRAIGRAFTAMGEEGMRPIAAYLDNDENVLAVARRIMQVGQIALAGLGAADLARDNSLITRMVTAILTFISEYIGPMEIVQGAITMGWNAGRMVAAATWPLVTLATFLIVRYAVREFWGRAYAFARDQVNRLPAEGERARAARTFGLATIVFVKQVFLWLRRGLESFRRNRDPDVVALDRDLAAYMAEAEAIRWARRARVMPAGAPPAGAPANAAQAAQAAIQALADAAAELAPLPAGEGGRRKTRKHRRHPRRTHKKRFHRK
jgi:hypothetical protein